MKKRLTKASPIASICCDFRAQSLVLWVLVLLFSLHGIAVCDSNGGMPRVTVHCETVPVLSELLQEHASALWQQKTGPESESQLRGPAKRHEERLKKVLHGEGYYGAVVTHRIVWSDTSPEVIFDVEPGAVYRLKAIEIHVWREAGDADEAEVPIALDSGLQPDAPARAQMLLDAEQSLVRQLLRGGYPYAYALDKEAQVNHDEEGMYIAYHLASGERLRFGAARLHGLEKVREEVVLSTVAWKAGDWYDVALVEKTRDRLQTSGLYTLVRTIPAPADTIEDGQIPIDLELTERRHRTISLGLQYRTDEGAGVAGDWEHRNFAGRGRTLRLRSQATELEQHFGFNYDFPEFLDPKNTLSIQGKTAQTDTDFYRSRRIDVGAWLERNFSPEITLGFGPALRAGRVKDRIRTQNYYLFSLPIQLSMDYRDDRMDPNHGYRFTERLTPFIDVHDTGVWFLKNEMNLSAFTPLGAGSGYTLATRLHLGVTAGAALGRIPADERFYAGGGGSIRGYGYQDVGPIDKKGRPTGGRSVMDWSIELRKRLNESFGLVAFVDGGAAHDTPYFDFNETVQWGAGVGIRYFTPIGPMRFDVAIPLNRRRDIDNTAQFYISIGQAF